MTNKLTQEQKLSIVKKLLDQGFGRRRIAQELKTTEWEVRTLINSFKDNTVISKPLEVTKVKMEYTREVSSSPIAGTKPKIVLRTSADQDDNFTKLSSSNITMKVACISDVHYPYQDEKAETVALAFLMDWKPDVLVLNGDIWDCYAVSSYEKSISKKMNIQQELDYGYDRLSHWMKMLGNPKGYFIEGNHEERFAKIVAKNAPALAALKNLQIQKNIDFKSLGVEYVHPSKDLFIGNLLYTHGTHVRRHGGNSGRAHFDQYGCSLIIGHTHRLAMLQKRTKFGTHTIIENGTLCDFDVEYTKYPDWQQGFTTMEYDGNDFTATLRPIINHKLIANGKVYSA